MTKLVIVESPTKARTIRGYLPAGYHVEASMGHVRDLPASASEIPAAHKGAPWARLGVNVEKDFKPLYVVPADKKKTIAKLKEELAKADELILATDEDREGESIGWHLKEVLKPKVPVRRMVFHEITREAIAEALGEMRSVDQDMVRAQETRRILDRLVGYTVSPLLWKKIAPRLSAGRVQSVAVRLLVLRERARRAFHIGTYWDLKALLAKRPDKPAHRFEATLVSVGGKRVATGRDFDESTGAIATGKDVLLLDGASAAALGERLRAGAWRVAEIEEKDQQRSPEPPFTTSTLQQEANRKLGLGARDTMRVAQSLYEKGFITYMRTDSVNLSQQAVSAARRRVRELYGDQYLSPAPRTYTTKSKGAQEAHEAIRPAGDQMRSADQLPIEGRERALYDLIWKRTIATQMANARLKFTTATIAVDDALFRATGRTVLFAGFFRAYVEGTDDPEAALESQDSPLPPLRVDEPVDCVELNPESHETKPPARYTEATLVKALEAEGIGRPSTYATIIDTILQRNYAFKMRKELVPTFTAFAVTQLLEDHFADLVDVGFTAGMEEDLDEIAAGQTDWLAYLRDFYLGKEGLEAQVRDKDGAIDPREVAVVALPGFPEDFNAEVRIGQFGPFVSRTVNGEPLRASLPPDLPPADLSPEKVDEILTRKVDGPTKLGVDPETEKMVYLKIGPYGPYVQLGGEDDGEEAGTETNGKEAAASDSSSKGKGKAKSKAKPKPKRASLLKGMRPDEMTLETALELLQLPRLLGENPDTGDEVKAGVGRFGPFVVQGSTYANIREPDNVLTIDLDRALELLAAKASGGTRTRAGVIRTIGENARVGKIELMNGRYGPYVTNGSKNATVPKDTALDAITLEQAVAWIDAAPERKTKTTKRSTAKKSSTKSTTAKKTTAKAGSTKKTSARKASTSKASSSKAAAA